MVMQQETNVKPSIKIYFNNQVNENDFQILLHGIEEEGIPYELKEVESSDVLDISYEASLSSKLGVGIGINRNEIALHFEKLNKNSPLFRINLDTNRAKIRILGSNAARLVKKMPFKEIND